MRNITLDTVNNASSEYRYHMNVPCPRNGLFETPTSLDPLRLPIIHIYYRIEGEDLLNR